MSAVVRVCVHCGRALSESSRSEARYCSDRCRAAAWKERRGYGARRAVRTGLARPSGLQLSWRRALREVTELTIQLNPHLADHRDLAEEIAETALKRALPERQRRRLEARQ